MAKLQPPDLIAAANTQGALNKQTALDIAGANRYTQVGPEGSRNEWITDPNTGAVSNVTTMGGRPQAMYDALMDNGNANLNTFQNKYWGGGAGGGGGAQMQMQSGGGGGVTPHGTTAAKIPGDIQKDLDYSGLTSMPGGDVGAARQEAQDALYGRATGYLDPQWQQQESATRTRLANQGLVPGTPAYDRAYANEARAKEQAYTGARQDAIAGGGAEAQRAQAMALELRRQGMSEADAKFAAHNAAQAQGAGQYLTARGQDTSYAGSVDAAGINAGASMSNAALANQLGTRQQEFYEMMNMGEGANKYLPQFGTSQGNVGAYNPADIYGATQQTYENQVAAKKAKKPGILGQLLPIAGTIAGSFAGNPALGAMIGKGLSSAASGGSAP